MKDVSHWEMVGFGVDSTLEKVELISPQTFLNESEEHRRYIIKYAREFEVGVSWEDITELIASEIGKQLGLKMMDIEMVTRNGRRGALLKNFVPLKGQFLEGGVYLSELDDYGQLISPELKGIELINLGFSQMEKLNFWNQIKRDFIEMNIFDILIGNQDRHPYNWMMLYHKDRKLEFSPIYDNGASLGFRFDDAKLNELITFESKANKYIRNARVRAGLFENKQVKAKNFIKALKLRYPYECTRIITEIEGFNFSIYNSFLTQQVLLSPMQKKWLGFIISLRREYILKWYREED